MDKLGDDFVGLTSTIANLLGFLNLAELGIGTAIGTVLYKPLFDKDRVSINEIISVFGYFYRIVGLSILGIGLILSFFLPFIFPDTEFPLILIYFTYYSFLASSLIGYFVNYKQTLLSADQRNYVVTAFFQISNLIKAIVQMSLAYYTQNYYYWVAIELIFGIIYSIILNWKIRQVYPWLSSDVKQGRLLHKKYPLIIKYTKQLIVHKIGSLVQFQLKPVLIFSLISLKTVAFHDNYALIIDKLSQLIKSVLGSSSAGVGSVVAENDENKIKKIFWELISLNYFIGAIISFALYYLLEPFISLWIGPEYIMNRAVLIIMIVNMFIMQTRGTVDQFLFAYGLFSDLWAPITETILSLGISLIGGYFWGLEGILLGSVISMFCIVVCWKPYFLYSKGFHLSLFQYWKEIFKILILLVLSWIIVAGLKSFFISVNPSQSYFKWIEYAFIIVSLYSIIGFVFLYTFVKGMRNATQRIFDRFFHKYIRK